METIPPGRTRCLVCGFSEVRTDEVAHRGVVLLAECARCQHRWTLSLDGGPRGRARVRHTHRVHAA